MSADDTVPGKLEDILRRLDEGDRRMNESDGLRAAMAVKQDESGKKLDAHDLKLDMLIKASIESKAAMDKNNAMTKNVEDYITTARVGKSVLFWVAGVATSIVAIWGAVLATIAHFKP